MDGSATCPSTKRGTRVSVALESKVGSQIFGSCVRRQLTYIPEHERQGGGHARGDRGGGANIRANRFVPPPLSMSSCSYSGVTFYSFQCIFLYTFATSRPLLPITLIVCCISSTG